MLAFRRLSYPVCPGTLCVSGPIASKCITTKKCVPHTNETTEMQAFQLSHLPLNPLSPLLTYLLTYLPTLSHPKPHAPACAAPSSFSSLQAIYSRIHCPFFSKFTPPVSVSPQTTGTPLTQAENSPQSQLSSQHCLLHSPEHSSNH